MEPRTTEHINEKEKNMCIFLSWLHYEGQILFITDDTLETNKGKALVEHLDKYYWDDITGHGALMHLHKIGSCSGDHMEIAFFSDPGRFPKPILEAIDKCKFRKVGVPEYAGDMLNKEAYETYDKQKNKETEIYEDDRKKINLINNTTIEALRTTNRIRYGKAGRAFDNICNVAYEERNIAVQILSDNYTGPKNICPERKGYLIAKEKIRNKCNQIVEKAMVKRTRIENKSDPKDKVNALFEKNNQELSDTNYKYKEKIVNRFWDLFEDKNNRKKMWRNIS
jgi:hypothetical protein